MAQMISTKLSGRSTAEMVKLGALGLGIQGFGLWGLGLRVQGSYLVGTLR